MRKLSTTFYPWTNNQTKKQNNIIEAYIWVFINYKQDNWAQLYFMAEFASHNAKYTSTSPSSFKLNYDIHPQASYKENINLCYLLKSADKLTTKLKELMTICRENLQHT